jgi:chorismate synthase
LITHGISPRKELKKMNLPNKLTVIRVIMIPFFLFFLAFPELVSSAEDNYFLARILAAAIFGIPAVKGIEFGSGFFGSTVRGSENADEIKVSENGAITTETNKHGGILGGISSGVPIVFNVAFKPTPTISKELHSVSISSGENVTLQARGRHDPCVVLRAVPCVEAVAAIAILDVLMEKNIIINEETK